MGNRWAKGNFFSCRSLKLIEWLLSWLIFELIWVHLINAFMIWIESLFICVVHNGKLVLRDTQKYVKWNRESKCTFVIRFQMSTFRHLIESDWINFSFLFHIRTREMIKMQITMCLYAWGNERSAWREASGEMLELTSVDDIKVMLHEVFEEKVVEKMNYSLKLMAVFWWGWLGDDVTGESLDRGKVLYCF